MDDTTKVFAQRMRLLMQEKGDLSFRDLAAKTDIPFNSLNDYANGRVAIPLNRARRIADVLGESIDWMAGETDIRRLKKIAN